MFEYLKYEHNAIVTLGRRGNRNKNQLKLQRSVWNKLCFVQNEEKILLTALTPI